MESLTTGPELENSQGRTLLLGGVCTMSPLPLIAIAGAMSKSAFAANAQAKVCAAAVVKLLAGQKPDETRLINTCYSLAAPGISIANVYRPKDGVLVDAGGGVSPANAPASFRAQEAMFANGWFKTITGEVFG